MLRQLIIIASALIWVSCGLFVDKPRENSSSSRSLEFSSSSFAAPEDTGRVEWDYDSTLQLNDTAFYRVSSENADLQRFYLGFLQAGDRIRLAVRTVGLDSTAQFRIKTELGKVQLPFAPVDEKYVDYHATLSSQWSENVFAVVDSGHLYLELSQILEFEDPDSVGFDAVVYVDTAYYAYCGGADTVTIADNSTVRGFFRLDRTVSHAQLQFSGDLGSNLTLAYQGEFMDFAVLKDTVGTTLDSAATRFSHQLLPSGNTQWSVEVQAVLPSYATGNYAEFSLHLSVVDLLPGEYWDKPDTLKTIGDTLRLTRAGSEFSGWDVRHDHYVYLGDFKAKDTLLLYYGTEGMNSATKSLHLLNAEAQEVQKLPRILGSVWSHAIPDTIAISKNGKYYLHYKSLGRENTHWTDAEFKLHFHLLVQKLGALNSWTISPRSKELKVGDTLKLSSIKATFAPQNFSGNQVFSLARNQRNILVDSLDLFNQSIGYEATGDQIGSGWLLAQEAGTANLLVKSVADPQKIDTCKITIIP